MALAGGHTGSVERGGRAVPAVRGVLLVLAGAAVQLDLRSVWAAMYQLLAAGLTLNVSVYRIMTKILASSIEFNRNRVSQLSIKLKHKKKSVQGVAAYKISNCYFQ